MPYNHEIGISFLTLCKKPVSLSLTGCLMGVELLMGLQKSLHQSWLLIGSSGLTGWSLKSSWKKKDPINILFHWINLFNWYFYFLAYSTSSTACLCFWCVVCTPYVFHGLVCKLYTENEWILYCISLNKVISWLTIIDSKINNFTNNIPVIEIKSWLVHVFSWSSLQQPNWLPCQQTIHHSHPQCIIPSDSHQNHWSWWWNKPTHCGPLFACTEAFLLHHLCVQNKNTTASKPMQCAATPFLRSKKHNNNVLQDRQLAKNRTFWR